MYEYNNQISLAGRPYHGHFVDEEHRVTIFYGKDSENAAVLLLETKTPRKYTGRSYPIGDEIELTLIGTRNLCSHCRVWHRG